MIKIFMFKHLFITLEKIIVPLLAMLKGMTAANATGSKSRYVLLSQRMGMQIIGMLGSNFLQLPLS